MPSNGHTALLRIPIYRLEARHSTRLAWRVRKARYSVLWPRLIHLALLYQGRVAPGLTNDRSPLIRFQHERR